MITLVKTDIIFGQEHSLSDDFINRIYLGYVCDSKGIRFYFCWILLMREMMFVVVIYFRNLVLYIRTESVFLVVRRCDYGSITDLNESRINNSS